jgi:hypothetical protein
MSFVKFSSRADHELKKLNNELELRKELALVFDKLENNQRETLDIKIISRNNKLRSIWEIRLKYPKEFRIFFSEKKEKDEIWILDLTPKKRNAFPGKYFAILEKIKLHVMLK